MKELTRANALSLNALDSVDTSQLAPPAAWPGRLRTAAQILSRSPAALMTAISVTAETADDDAAPVRRTAVRIAEEFGFRCQINERAGAATVRFSRD